MSMERALNQCDRDKFLHTRICARSGEIRQFHRGTQLSADDSLKWSEIPFAGFRRESLLCASLRGTQIPRKHGMTRAKRGYISFLCSGSMASNRYSTYVLGPELRSMLKKIPVVEGMVNICSWFVLFDLCRWVLSGWHVKSEVMKTELEEISLFFLFDCPVDFEIRQSQLGPMYP
jgi:hypothetical protein